MKKFILINAIVWAALILIGSYLFKGHENWNMMFIFLISGYGIVHSALVGLYPQEKKCKSLS